MPPCLIGGSGAVQSSRCGASWAPLTELQLLSRAAHSGGQPISAAVYTTRPTGDIENNRRAAKALPRTAQSGDALSGFQARCATRSPSAANSAPCAPVPLRPRLRAVPQGALSSAARAQRHGSSAALQRPHRRSGRLHSPRAGLSNAWRQPLPRTRLGNCSRSRRLRRCYTGSALSPARIALPLSAEYRSRRAQQRQTTRGAAVLWAIEEIFTAQTQEIAARRSSLECDFASAGRQMLITLCRSPYAAK